MLQIAYMTFIPVDQELCENTLYISRIYDTATHLCPCGCRNKVVTPLNKPHGWVLSENGSMVTLFPSIGNFHIPCRSHYWIRNNEIVWV